MYILIHKWIDESMYRLRDKNLVAQNPGAYAVTGQGVDLSGQGVDPVVLDPFLHHLPQSWPLCCTKPWSLRGVWARC